MEQTVADKSLICEWTYNQRTGQLRSPTGYLYKQRGYSGSSKENYKNNPDLEHVPFRGPIPRGAYIIGGDTGGKGPLTLILTPDGHDAYGRTDFRIHGDSIKFPGTASEGCIILNKDQRRDIYNSRDRVLRVVDEPEWQE